LNFGENSSLALLLMILMGSLPHAADSCGDVERVFFFKDCSQRKIDQRKGQGVLNESADG